MSTGPRGNILVETVNQDSEGELKHGEPKYRTRIEERIREDAERALADTETAE